MIYKQICAQEFDKLFGGEMIPDIRKADSRGNAAGPAKRAKQRGLAYTVTPPAFQNIAGPVMFGSCKIL